MGLTKAELARRAAAKAKAEAAAAAVRASHPAKHHRGGDATPAPSARSVEAMAQADAQARALKHIKPHDGLELDAAGKPLRG